MLDLGEALVLLGANFVDLMMPVLLPDEDFEFDVLAV